MSVKLKDGCVCAYMHTWISKTEQLYLVRMTNYKMEKILEMKLVMNWLLSKSDILLYIKSKLTETTLQERLDIVSCERRQLQQQYPIYFHCNKNLITNCLVMLLRQKKFNLKDYEDLYDTFDF